MKNLDISFALKTASGARVEVPVVVDLSRAAQQVEGAEISLEAARAAFRENRADPAAHRAIESAAEKYLSVFFGDDGVAKLTEFSGGNIPAVYLAARPFLEKHILPAIRRESRARYKALRRAARKK